jgi:kumamolisin
LYPPAGSASFRDITSGSNGAFDAGPGYDMVTGLGVPNVKQFIQALN